MATFIVSVDDQIVESKERGSVENKIRVLDKVTDVQPLFPDKLPAAFPENPVVKSMSKLLMVTFNIAAGNAAEISDATARLKAVKGVEKAAHAPMLERPRPARH